jgi:hypothetical protein
MWALFGLNLHDVWELDAFDFFSLATACDKQRTEKQP